MRDRRERAERPPDRRQWEAMGFGELRELIDDSLRKLPDVEADANRPQSKEEFATLVEILDAKLDPLRKEAANELPPSPTYKGPSYVSPWFEPSGQLASLHDRHDLLSRRLIEAQYEPSSDRRRIEHELRDLEREIDLRETGEKEEHERHHAEYVQAHREASAAYERSRRLWRRQKHEQDKKCQSLALREQIVEKRRRDIERAFSSGSGVPTMHTSWDLAPPGAASEANLRRVYTDLRSQGRLAGFDQDRLDKLIMLNPKQRYVGKRGFEGYSIFTFSYTAKAIMECFIRGNAIFVLDADPEHWPEKNKQELRENPLAIWIPHQGDWYRRVREALDLE
jgi:hypothetical protein